VTTRPTTAPFDDRVPITTTSIVATGVIICFEVPTLVIAGQAKIAQHLTAVTDRSPKTYFLDAYKIDRTWKAVDVTASALDVGQFMTSDGTAISPPTGNLDELRRLALASAALVAEGPQRVEELGLVLTDPMITALAEANKALDKARNSLKAKSPAPIPHLVEFVNQRTTDAEDAAARCDIASIAKRKQEQVATVIRQMTESTSPLVESIGDVAGTYDTKNFKSVLSEARNVRLRMDSAAIDNLMQLVGLHGPEVTTHGTELVIGLVLCALSTSLNVSGRGSSEPARHTSVSEPTANMTWSTLYRSLGGDLLATQYKIANSELGLLPVSLPPADQLNALGINLVFNPALLR
jgi:hypothetical protein